MSKPRTLLLTMSEPAALLKHMGVSASRGENTPTRPRKTLETSAYSDALLLLFRLIMCVSIVYEID